MKIEEVRKIMSEAAQPAMFRVAYLTIDDVRGTSVLDHPFRLSPEPHQPPIDKQEADAIASAMIHDLRFRPYNIVRAWIVEA